MDSTSNLDELYNELSLDELYDELSRQKIAKGDWFQKHFTIPCLRLSKPISPTTE